MTPNGTNIPVIDLAEARHSATDRQRLADSIDAGLRETGFLLIEGHGVSEEVVASAWHAAVDFFARPVDEKMRLSSGKPDNPRGYFPVASEALDQADRVKDRDGESIPDQKEAFSAGSVASSECDADMENFDFFYGENLWPAQPVSFRESWLKYFHSMETLSAELMSLFAVALGLDGTYFGPYFNRHVSALRGLHYPPCEKDSDAPGPRAGAHTDYGSLTILKSDAEVAGLEIQRPSGEWLAAPMSQSGFLVNIGDLLARWSGDRWVSTPHRVVAGAGSAGRSRHSIAFFQNPNPDALIHCLANDAGRKSAPIIAGDYLRQQFLGALTTSDVSR